MLEKKLLPFVCVALMLCNISCVSLSYGYNKIKNKEKIKFENYQYAFFPEENILTVEKLDGTKIIYADTHGDDLQLEWVWVKKDRESRWYYVNNELDRLMMRKFQREFDEYLRDE